MKRILFLMFGLMAAMVSISTAASTISILPDYGLNQISTRTLKFPEINPNQSSGYQFQAFVVANETMPWHINMKVDYFTLNGSTQIIPVWDVRYRVVYGGDGEKPTGINGPNYIAPWYFQTVYTSSSTEYVTKGTTITMNITLSPGKQQLTGHYSSKLSLEIGDYK